MQLKPCEFWSLTYAEFTDMVDGYNRNKKRRRDELLFAAWHTALFTRTDKFPDLNEILKIDPVETENVQPVGKKEPDHNAMMEMAKALTAKWGGKIIQT